LIKEYKSVAASRAVKAYVRFCFDNDDSFEDDIDNCMLAELAVFKSSRYLFHGSYRQWDINCEWMLHDVHWTKWCWYKTQPSLCIHVRRAL